MTLKRWLLSSAGLVLLGTNLARAQDAQAPQARQCWRGQATAVAPQGKARQVTKTYMVADLIIPYSDEPQPHPVASTGDRPEESTGLQVHTTGEDLLIEIQRAVAPDSWSNKGGQGKIDYFPLTMSLVINQTPEIQQRITEFLAQKRRLQPHEYKIEMKVVLCCPGKEDEVLVAPALTVFEGQNARLVLNEQLPCASGKNGMVSPSASGNSLEWKIQVKGLPTGDVRMNLDFVKQVLVKNEPTDFESVGQHLKAVRVVKPGKVVKLAGKDGEPTFRLEVKVCEIVEPESTEANPHSLGYVEPCKPNCSDTQRFPCAGATNGNALRGAGQELRIEESEPPSEVELHEQCEHLLLEGQHYFRMGQYKTALNLFKKVAAVFHDDMAEEACFSQAECLRMQQQLPAAAEAYVTLLNDYPCGRLRGQVVQRIFDIANYWLDDTREDMRRIREFQEGKRLFVLPQLWTMDPSKPFLREETRALELLEQIRCHDPLSPLAEKALFLAGSVHFYREDYQEADSCLSRLVEQFPESGLVASAVEMAIVAKELSLDSCQNKEAKVQEVAQMLRKVLKDHPELGMMKQDFFGRHSNWLLKQSVEDLPRNE
jgi:tetratricopeptide (TPR) repeat protein